jgi:hypothetical protein
MNACTWRPVNEVAGLSENCGGHHEYVFGSPKPSYAVRMVLVPAVSEGVEDVRVNEDHKTGRLPAEAVR